MSSKEGHFPNERSWVERAQRGDTEAFGELVKATMHRSYAIAYGLVGSADDALDLSQEAYVRAYRAHAKLDPDRPFFPWVYVILRRLCFTFLRDRKSHREKLEEASPWMRDEIEHRQAAAEPDRVVLRAELREAMARAIDDLPDHEREVLVLQEVEGLKYREIAEVVGIPLGTVMSRLYSARRRLAKALEETS